MVSVDATPMRCYYFLTDGSALKMEISSVSQAGAAVKLFLKGEPALLFKVGEVLRAEVLDILSDDTVSIRLKNEVIEAKTSLPLQKGATLLLQVEALENGVKLKWVGAPPEENSIKNVVLAALNHLKGARLTGEEIKSFVELINRLPAPVKESGLLDLNRFFAEMKNLTGETLKEALQSSGVFFETKLRTLTVKLLANGLASGTPNELEKLINSDLKGILLKIKNNLDGAAMEEALKEGNVKPGAVNATIDKLLNQIEHQQLISRLNETFQPFIPLIWKELKEGELIFKETYEGAEGERDYSVTIYLDLERIGKLVTHILMQGGSFYLRFITENQPFHDLLQANATLLEKQLDACGLRCGNVTIQHEEKIELKNHTSSGLDLIV